MGPQQIQRHRLGHTRLTYDRFIEWRERYISEKNLVLLLSFIVGGLSALAANILKSLIYYIQHLVECHMVAHHHFWYFICPMLGIALAALFVYFIVRDDISHGITKILYAISQRKSIIKLHNVWTSLVGSALTIGFGGSVGAEAPIVLTGSAIGSNLAKMFRLNQKTMMLMIGCGAAGAIGGIFKAPIAGLVFTLEVLLMDLTMTSVAPLLISSVTATAISYMIGGAEPMFEFTAGDPFVLSRIPWYMLLGVLCGLVSLYFVRSTNVLERWFRRHLRSLGTKIITGGAVLGLLIFLFPPLYGEGYDVIISLINGHADELFQSGPFASTGSAAWVVVLYIALMIFFKSIAAVATNGGGGVGGIFAPTLFTGALVGFVTARLLNMAGAGIPETNFALVGMSGLMSGVMFAPLTGIFLIAELTGGYHLFMPLMIVSVTSYLVIRLFESHSLYAIRLAQKGELLTHNKDRAILTLMQTASVMETDCIPLMPEMTLGELVKVIARSQRNIFPVVDENDHLRGMLPLDEVRNIMFQQRLYNRFTVEQLMTSPPAVLTTDMPMEKVMEIFEDTGAWNLPVVTPDKRYAGMMSKSRIFSSYRDVLVQFSDE